MEEIDEAIQSLEQNSSLCALLDERCEQKRLCKFIVSKILDFASRPEPGIFFIQLPVEELSNNPKKQDKLWLEFVNACALALRLSLKSQNLIPETLTYPGDWYKSGDTFLVIPEENDQYDYYFLEVPKTQNKNNKVKLNFICSNPKFAAHSSEKQRILQSAQKIVRLTSIPNQRRLNNGFESCKEEISLLDYHIDESKALSGVIVCPSANNRSIDWAGVFVKPVVELVNTGRFQNVPKSTISLLVGDRSFPHLANRLINGVGRNGISEKLIFIGTKPTENILKNSELHQISFPDAYNLLATSKKQTYKDPVFISIKFEWLDQTLSSLQSLLNEYNDSIADDVAKHIYNATRKWLSSMDFNSVSLKKFKEYFKDQIGKELSEDQDDLYDKLSDWVESLTYEGSSNPKKDYISKNFPQSKLINTRRSIKRQLKGHADNTEYILDAPFHIGNPDFYTKATKSEDPISTVLRFHLYAEIKALYYECESGLMKRTQAAIKKDALYEQMEISDSSIDNDWEEFLANYVDCGEYYSSSFSNSDTGTSVEFSDGTKEILNGDVLISEEDTWRAIHVESLDNESGTRIIFYNSGEDDMFTTLSRRFYGLSEDNSPEYYSGLWQEALRKIVEGMDSSAQKAFCKECGISRAVLNNHINGTSLFMHRKKMDRVLAILVEKKYLSESECQQVKASRAFLTGTCIKFGQQLKDALYTYKIDKYITPFMVTLLEKSNMGIEDISNHFLIEKVLK